MLPLAPTLFSLHLQFGKDDDDEGDGVETTTSSFEKEEENTEESTVVTTTEAGEDFFDPVPAEDPTECEQISAACIITISINLFSPRSAAGLFIKM